MGDQPPAKIWDPLVRVFLWSLVVGVALAANSGFRIGGRAIGIHFWAGTATAFGGDNANPMLRMSEPG